MASNKCTIFEKNFMDLLVSVKDEKFPADNELLKDILIAIEEIKLIKSGKKKGRIVEDLLNEL